MSTETFDPTASSALDPSLIPDISLDTELVDESQPFLGVIVLDQWEPNYNKDGYQWVLGVRPIDFAVKGEHGCFFARANISTSPNSKMGIMLGAFQKIYGREKIKVGKGQLRGRIGVFVNRTVNFGVANDGTERKARVTIPVRKPTDDEAARAEGIAQAVLAGTPLPESGAPAQPTAPAAAEFTPAERAAILAVIEGKTPQEFQLAALTSGLAPQLMNAVLSGAALAQLTKAGVVRQDADGRVLGVDELPF